MRSVFLNFPYDAEYLPIFEAIAFSVAWCGYRPKAAGAEYNSAELRLKKIRDLIKTCDLSIHDLSPARTADLEQLRLNMAFELGLAFGLADADLSRDRPPLLAFFENTGQKERLISDLGGVDGYVRPQSPLKLFLIVRLWLSKASGRVISGNKRFEEDYACFLYERAQLLNLFQLQDTDEGVSMAERIDIITAWISVFQKSPELSSESRISAVQGRLQ